MRWQMLNDGIIYSCTCCMWPPLLPRKSGLSPQVNLIKKLTPMSEPSDHKKQFGCSQEWLHTAGTTVYVFECFQFALNYLMHMQCTCTEDAEVFSYMMFL